MLFASNHARGGTPVLRALTGHSFPAKRMQMEVIAPQIADLSFEDALRSLEDVVRRLESGDVPLGESITLYERGEALRRHCQARLDAAQTRIESIVAGADGKPVGTTPFGVE